LLEKNIYTRIGEASVAAARVRPPFAGGERAVYDDSIL